MKQQVQITASGIRKALRRFKVESAICEYIWNGFDAGATEVELIYETHHIELGGIKELKIRDNGVGIDYRNLDRTFKPFYQTYRELAVAAKSKLSAVHGKNGIGRLTFFCFAKSAKWNTSYTLDEGDSVSYSITVDQDSLDTFSLTEPVNTKRGSSTEVVFQGIDGLSAHEIQTKVKREVAKNFAWFLELNREKQYQILINGEQLDYTDLIVDSDKRTIAIRGRSEKHLFAVRFILWSRKLGNEYSRYYFIDSENNERYNRTTTLNNKGDNFFHSVYITSEYFNGSSQIPLSSAFEDDLQISLFNPKAPVLKELIQKVDKFLRDKRKPLLEQHANRLIEAYESDGIFPERGKNDWDLYRHKRLEDVVRELYKVRPTLFLQLNMDQKKTFVHLLNLALDKEERDDLFKILQQTIELDADERMQLAQHFQYTQLANISKMIELIKDRFRAVDALKQLVFNTELNAYEKHVQDMIEQHYWLFGEEYHLVTAAEPDFEEALRRYIYLLRGENENVKIEHKDRKKEMDIFAVRRLPSGDTIENIVVELKRPKLSLGESELSQVKKYMRVILSKDEFNDSNMTWRFYLVGNRFDSSKYIKGEIETNKNHGERALVYSMEEKRIRIYVKTWNEIFNEFELRHRFMQDKLSLERKKLISPSDNADNLIKTQGGNIAARPPEPEMPHKS